MYGWRTCMVKLWQRTQPKLLHKSQDCFSTHTATLFASAGHPPTLRRQHPALQPTSSRHTCQPPSPDSHWSACALHTLPLNPPTSAFSSSLSMSGPEAVS
eukprot:1004116-Rhodomonas_salina.1